MTELRLATIAVAGVIAGAYHVCGRAPEDARTAIIEWLNSAKGEGAEMTVGDLYDFTEFSGVEQEGR